MSIQFNKLQYVKCDGFTIIFNEIQGNVLFNNGHMVCIIDTPNELMNSKEFNDYWTIGKDVK